LVLLVRPGRNRPKGESVDRRGGRRAGDGAVRIVPRGRRFDSTPGRTERAGSRFDTAGSRFDSKRSRIDRFHCSFDSTGSRTGANR
jgi:hypothetical protein